MKTKREYAISLGLAKEGRGRLSREAHAAIAKAESEGVKFAESGPVVVRERANASDIKVVKTTQSESKDNFSEPRLAYPIDQMFKGQDSHGKTHRVNARQGCMRGTYSLAGCFEHTGQPHTVLLNSMEVIEVQPIGE